MDSIALVITHHTLPGQRDAVRTVWEKHLAPAIAGNPGHLAYYYCFDEDQSDVITAFQQYRSAEDAAAFLTTDSYLVYEREVATLLVGPPQVQRLTPIWATARA